jgi:transcriptional regulator with XRE-family HTH domain
MMTEIKDEEFSEWLRREIRARRMSLRQLAARSGVNASTVSRVARGDRRPSLKTALLLVQVLHAPGEPIDAAGRLRSVSRGFDPVVTIERALRADTRLAEADVRRVMRLYHGLRGPEPATSGPGSVTELGA